jgi:hypothetical protein
LINISDKSAKLLQAAGALLLIAALLLIFQWKTYIYSLPYYKILALLSPLLFCKSLLIIDAYRKPWSSLDPRSKVHAVMFPLTPIATAIAALIWYFHDPIAGP